MSVYLLSINLSVYLSVYLPICISIYLSIYLQSPPTAVRVAFHGILRNSNFTEFPEIQVNFLSHAQEKLQKCASKCTIKRCGEMTVQKRI